MQENTRPLKRIIYQNEEKKPGSETRATNLLLKIRAVRVVSPTYPNVSPSRFRIARTKAWSNTESLIKTVYHLTSPGYGQRIGHS